MWRHYEGHAVPDLPASPGENMRSAAAEPSRTPRKNRSRSQHRTRRLFADDPLLPRLRGQVAEILRQSFLDLDDAKEWRKLGLGVFLDRPLGVGKAAAEPDATLLLSAKGFSVSSARQRLLALAGDLGVKPEDPHVQKLLARPSLPGLPLDAISSGQFTPAPFLSPMPAAPLPISSFSAARPAV